MSRKPGAIHCKLRENRALARIVAHKLRMLWSPEQIAGWLKQTYPCDESQHVSHESIYRSLFIHEPLGPLTASAQRHCETIEREAAQDAGLSHTR